MSEPSDLRAGEVDVTLPGRPDASLYFIGIIHTPWVDRRACPRSGDRNDGPVCRLVLHEPWWPALEGLAAPATLDVLYWMHMARRDLVRQNPKARGACFGTFSLRSPVRPNPIALSCVALLEVEAGALVVRGLDCLDGTPLIDIKPNRCPV